MRIDSMNSRQSYRLALISSHAVSIANFRGSLVREMIRRGATVYAFAPDHDDASRSEVLSLGAVPVDCSMSRTGMNPLRDIGDLLRLTMQLRRLKLDATFAYFIKPVIYGTLAARLAGVPERYSMIEGAGYVFTDDAKPTIRRRLLRNFVIRLYRLGLSQAEHVFMLNPDDKALFVNEGMVAANKVHLLDGIGLELHRYQVARPVFRPVCFILIGRMLREKGIYDFIEAARSVKTHYSEVRFILLGSIDVNPGSISKAEVHTWVAEGIVEWPGHVPDVRPWIAEASVFVLPSYREGLPRSTQEAMAMGRPVITTDAPGCRETVVQGVNGFIVPIRDSDALAQAMMRFVDQPELIEPMGAASRRMAEERFNAPKINAAILDVMTI